MLDGICTNSYSRLRHALEQDFAFFAAAAACSPGSDHRARDAESVCAELDAQETRFLTNFWRLLEAGHYKLLTASAWDAALAEEFLLTLPVKVNWDALDSELLPRALWPSRPEDRQSAPEELADRVLVFHRGVDVARKQVRVCLIVVLASTSSGSCLRASFNPTAMRDAASSPLRCNPGTSEAHPAPSPSHPPQKKTKIFVLCRACT
jgi:hypothetical protein